MSAEDKKAGEQSPVVHFAPKTPLAAQRMFFECLKDDQWAPASPARDVLFQLATDPRMTAIWEELLKKKSDGTLIYRPLEYPPDEMPGVLLVYWSVLENVHPWLPTLSRARASATAMRRDAAGIRDAADETPTHRQKAAFETYARALDREGRKLQRQIRSVQLPNRERIPPKVAGTIRGLIVAHNDIFGRPIDGVTAKLVAIIHNFEVSSSAIQKHTKALKYADGQPPV